MSKEIFTAEWFPWYHERILGSDRVAIMSLAEEGAYRRLIDYLWKNGSIAKDPKVCALRIGKKCSEKTAIKILEMCEPMRGNPARMINVTVEEIRAEQEAKYLARSRGGKATADKRWNNRTSAILTETENSSAIAQLQVSDSLVVAIESEIEIESEKREEKEKRRAEETTALHIHQGTILAGVEKELGLKKLSGTAQRAWLNEASLAFENGFSANDFIECFSLLRVQRGYAIRPEWVTDNLPSLASLRKKAGSNGNGKPKGLTGRELAAEVERKEREEQI